MDAERAVRTVMNARAVRERAHEMLAVGEAEGLASWSLDLDRLAAVEAFTLAVIRESYPDLAIPFHSRWRHFEVAGMDRGAPYRHGGGSAPERGRAGFDLAIVSVLLDAGAGERWRYKTSGGPILARSEGLAAASVDMFEAGVFSSRPDRPLQVDAVALARLTRDALARGFQASEANPLEGLDGRLGLLRALGRALESRPDLFTPDGGPRPGGLFDYFVGRAGQEPLTASAILEILLDVFGAIWPSRLCVAGVPLGDVWLHEAIRRDDATDRLAPFHKLSQWMAYSLIEPLEWSGVAVGEVDGLTGLAEYRNGGLFVDFDVLILRDRDEARRTQRPESPLIVEWRALTIALLDLLAQRLRRSLGMDAAALPLARVLQGGTWLAGRKIALERRPGGAPPLAIVSDGTVF